MCRWIEQFLPDVKIWMSDKNLSVGGNWLLELRSALEECHFGIICITPENKAAPWLHFEAGAIAKVDTAKVIPLLYNLDFDDLSGPMKNFQAVKVSKDDIWGVLLSISHASGGQIEKRQLLFEATWESIQTEVNKIGASAA